MWSSASRKLRAHDLLLLHDMFVLLNVLVSVVEDVVIEDDVEVVRVTS